MTDRLPLIGPCREQALKALSTDPLDTFPAFVEAVSARLEQGRATYGDASFDRPVTELLGEIEQELFDVCGWSFILWIRLQRLKGAIGEDIWKV